MPACQAGDRGFESRRFRHRYHILSSQGPNGPTLQAVGPFLFQRNPSPPPRWAIPGERRIVEHLNVVQAQVAERKRLQTESVAELERLSRAVLARAFRGEL
jgi:hypothetical protein